MNRKQSVCQPKTFQWVFDQHSETIRNFIYYRCGNIEQAEDITQEAFIKLWENCKKVLVEKAKSFVMKVAQNAFYKEYQHQKVMLKQTEKPMPPMESIAPDFLMEEKEFLNRLEKAIADLAPKQREVFLLSRKDKKTYREIAEIIGITQKAVERRMSIALEELRQKIGFKI